jgi:aminomethyltransferase
VRKHLTDGPPKRRVGMIIDEAPARRESAALTTTININLLLLMSEGARIYANGSEIGKVTSGIPSPTLGKNVAMGYVKSGFHKKGTEIEVDVRSKMRKAVVTPMPFVKANYWRG